MSVQCKSSMAPATSSITLAFRFGGLVRLRHEEGANHGSLSPIVTSPYGCASQQIDTGRPSSVTLLQCPVPALKSHLDLCWTGFWLSVVQNGSLWQTPVKHLDFATNLTHRPNIQTKESYKVG